MQKEVMPPDSATIPAPTFLESHQDTLWIYGETYSFPLIFSNFWQGLNFTYPYKEQ